jgi:hypothetical protein
MAQALADGAYYRAAAVHRGGYRDDLGVGEDMNRHRIEVAIAHLRSIPADVANKHVDMFSCGWTGFEYSAAAILRSCETKACPGGWLCFVPEFNQDGLRMHYDAPRFLGEMGYDAMAMFFAITSDKSLGIFGGWVVPRYGKAALDAVCDKLEALL